MTVLADGWTLTQRKLLRLRHEPGALATTLVAPAVFVVVLGCVAGAAVRVLGVSNHHEYLVPGLFVLATGFALSSSVMDVTADRARGVMERLRSLPMNQFSLSLGQSGAEGIVGVYALVVFASYGLVVGWRPHNGLGPALAGVGLLLLFQYAMSWVGTYLGLVVRSARTAAALAALMVPLTLASTAFVPAGALPAWLRVIGEWNPLSALATAARSLFGNPGAPGPDAPWPLAHPVAATLLWAGALSAIFIPVSARRFARAGL